MPDLARAGACLLLCAAGYLALQRLAMRLSIRLAAPKSGAKAGAPPILGDAAAAVTGLQIFSIFMLLTARPGMAALLALALIILLMALNITKEKVLREPLVLADAWLLPQVWKYPEMYFPFLPLRPIILGLVGAAALLALLLFVESPVPRGENVFLYSVLGVLAAAPIIFIVLLRYRMLPDGLALALLSRLPVSHNAAQDAARNGALAAALMHPLLAGQIEREQPDWLRNAHQRPKASRWPDKFEEMLREVETAPLDKCPHVLLVQAESFCDIREYVSGEQREALKNFLPNWDRLKAEGRILPTPENAYGAYTMRTEFSMLTGLQMEQLGAFAFNPYILAGRQPMWSLARFFRDKGYDTLCMHPYHKGFFGRDKVMPNLGFNKFLGIEELADLPKFGPYTSDAALGEKALQIMQASPKPLFCLMITMEAHGPWQNGRLTELEINNCLDDINRNLFDNETQIYLCHLRHMDGLLATLEIAVPQERKRALFAYGDHRPSIKTK